ncbi:zinc finger E-box-binding homeobox 1-like [Macrosteles quadrilineatus]|uniref:zinc finger E-box-binding homeobox 1-like n=1 Tax=Macrosteles quadrilineatus TaxID=74068 RepID=UPI0023E322EB|nr:zinc finger E-box-binding homeobox 1-like [Macrosteles quadrilineatus]
MLCQPLSTIKSSSVRDNAIDFVRANDQSYFSSEIYRSPRPAPHIPYYSGFNSCLEKLDSSTTPPLQISEPPDVKRGRGRPKGSYSKQTLCTSYYQSAKVQPNVKRGRGRPKGSQSKNYLLAMYHLSDNILSSKKLKTEDEPTINKPNEMQQTSKHLKNTMILNKEETCNLEGMDGNTVSDNYNSNEDSPIPSQDQLPGCKKDLLNKMRYILRYSMRKGAALKKKDLYRNRMQFLQQRIPQEKMLFDQSLLNSDQKSLSGKHETSNKNVSEDKSPIIDYQSDSISFNQSSNSQFEGNSSGGAKSSAGVGGITPQECEANIESSSLTVETPGQVKKAEGLCVSVRTDIFCSDTALKNVKKSAKKITKCVELPDKNSIPDISKNLNLSLNPVPTTVDDSNLSLSNDTTSKNTSKKMPVLEIATINTTKTHEPNSNSELEASVKATNVNDFKILNKEVAKNYSLEMPVLEVFNQATFDGKIDCKSKVRQENGKWVCECGKAFQHRNSIWNHLRYQCGKQKQFICTICQKQFARKHGLQGHMQYQHDKSI